MVKSRGPCAACRQLENEAALTLTASSTCRPPRHWARYHSSDGGLLAGWCVECCSVSQICLYISGETEGPSPGRGIASSLGRLDVEVPGWAQQGFGSSPATGKPQLRKLKTLKLQTSEQAQNRSTTTRHGMGEPMLQHDRALLHGARSD